MLFKDQMLEKLVWQGWYYFLDRYFSYNQIYIAPKEKENTTLTFPYGTFAFKSM